MEPFNGLFLNCSRGLDLALGKPGKNFPNQQNIKDAVVLG